MIETLQSPTKTNSASSYFRRLFEARPDLLDSRRNEELLAHWLRDHPNYPMVPATVKKSLANLKSLMRKKRRQSQAQEGAAPEVLDEPEHLVLSDPAEQRASETIHDSPKKSCDPFSETVHDTTQNVNDSRAETIVDQPRKRSRWETLVEGPFASRGSEKAQERPALSLRPALARPFREPRTRSANRSCSHWWPSRSCRTDPPIGITA